MTVLSCLYEDPKYENDDDAIDIVAVHGPGGHYKHTWTDPKTGKLWLRDFVPELIKKARVLSFGYSLGGLSLEQDIDEDDDSGCSHSNAPDLVTHFASLRNIENVATSLMTDLYSDRGLKKCQKRPIVFVCHGLSGVIVQQALVQSESYKRLSDLSTAHSLYLSTWAVLFFSTPFDSIDERTWLALKTVPYLDFNRLKNRRKRNHPSTATDTLKLETAKVSETLWATAQGFRQIMTSLNLHFFWEDCETDFGEFRGVVVPQEKAAPNLPDVGHCGIQANYNNMVRFSSARLTSYRTVSFTLSTLCENVVSKIKNRWIDAEINANSANLQKASERLGIKITTDHIPEDRRKREDADPLENFYKPPATVSSLFVGRVKERREIQDAFFRTAVPSEDLSQVPKRFVVCGIGGSGKTELCRKFAEDNKERYYAVFTITAVSRQHVSDSFASIGKAARLSTHATEEQGKDWLINHSHQSRPWLLIIDNADDPKLELQDLCPSGGNGHVLITTRNSNFQHHPPDGFLKLAGLEEEDAVRLLFDCADIHGPWDKATKKEGKRIARTMGCLARAIVQAGSSIMCHQLTLDKYLPHWQRYRKRRQDKGFTNEDEDRIFAAFDVSLDYLKQRDREDCQDALDLLSVISFYHFENIPVDAFYRAMKNNAGNAIQVDDDLHLRLMREAVKRVQPPPALPQFIRQDGQRKNELRIRAALKTLRSVSFASLDEGGASFSIHPLLRDWVRDGLDRPMKRFWGTIALNILTESVLLPPGDAGESHGEFRKQILPHLHSCLTDRVFQKRPIEIPNYENWWGKVRLYTTAILRPTALHLIRERVVLVAKCGYIYASCGRFQESVSSLRQVANILLQLRGPKDEKTMSAMLALAGILWGLGQREMIDEAITLQKQVVEARTSVLSVDHPDTLRAMTHLGKSYWLRGYHHEALALQEDTAMRMAKNQNLGERHPDTLEAMDLYGVTLGSFLRFKESMEIHEKVLDLRDQEIQLLRRDAISAMRQQDSRPSSANSIGTELGSSHQTDLRDQNMNIVLDRLSTLQYLSMAKLDLWLTCGPQTDLTLLHAAQQNMLDVLKHRKQLLGEEHPWTLWAVCNLAKVNIELELLTETEVMLDKGISAAKRALGENHPGVLMGFGELAKVYSRRGDFTKAEEKTKKLVEKLGEATGEDHPDTVFATWKLSNLYERQQKWPEAVNACEDALRKGDLRLTRKYPLCKKIAAKLHDLQRRLPPENPEIIPGITTGLEPRVPRRMTPRLLSRRTFVGGKIGTW
ncbi:TPR-like protein [Stipitochalara longipes BDJ]|nr:TPR-like protein [Stipitochalara longipes BDJ]